MFLLLRFCIHLTYDHKSIPANNPVLIRKMASRQLYDPYLLLLLGQSDFVHRRRDGSNKHKQTNHTLWLIGGPIERAGPPTVCSLINTHVHIKQKWCYFLYLTITVNNKIIYKLYIHYHNQMDSQPGPSDGPQSITQRGSDTANWLNYYYYLQRVIFMFNLFRNSHK